MVFPMSTLLTLALPKLWPHGDQHRAGLLEGIVASAPAIFEKYGLTTPLLVAHAMGQFSEECGAGLELVENLNYSAEGLARTWPSHFTGSMAWRYAHNPRMIADVAYGGRMGNAPPPSDDGWQYRGRGPSQCTGKANYQKLAEQLELDLIDDPDLINDPARFLECGVADWVMCGCLPHAQKDDVVGETKALNGGLIGLADRRVWISRWKRELGA